MFHTEIIHTTDTLLLSACGLMSSREILILLWTVYWTPELELKQAEA